MLRAGQVQNVEEAAALLRTRESTRAAGMMDGACAFMERFTDRKMIRPVIELDLAALQRGFRISNAFRYDFSSGLKPGVLHLAPITGVNDFYIATGLAMHNLERVHLDTQLTQLGMREFREGVIRAGAMLFGYLYQFRDSGRRETAGDVMLGFGALEHMEYSMAVYNQAKMRYVLVVSQELSNETYMYNAMMDLMLRQNRMDASKTAASLLSEGLHELRDGLISFAQRYPFSKIYGRKLPTASY